MGLKEIFQYLHDSMPMHDKMAHLYYATIASLLFYAIFRMSAVSIYIILFLSILKEFIDMSGGSYFDWMDVLYSVIPPLIITLIVND